MTNINGGPGGPNSASNTTDLAGENVLTGEFNYQLNTARDSVPAQRPAYQHSLQKADPDHNKKPAKTESNTGTQVRPNQAGCHYGRGGIDPNN